MTTGVEGGDIIVRNYVSYSRRWLPSIEQMWSAKVGTSLEKEAWAVELLWPNRPL